MAENLHKNHRKRLRQELLAQDFPDTMPDHKILETLLFYGVPQKDTNPLAHELINTFGSLYAVFEADADDLFQVKGMTERSVVLIKLMLSLFRRYNSHRSNMSRKFESVEHICEELVNKHMGYGKEVFMITSLNEVGDFIACDVLAKGNSTGVLFETKEIVKKALKHKATFVILSHNHLSGSTVPSQIDIETTARLNFTLREMGIKLLDHIIVAGNQYVSMSKNKYYEPDI